MESRAEEQFAEGARLASEPGVREVDGREGWQQPDPNESINAQPCELTIEQVCELAFQCAGAGTGAVMQDAPDVVMPTERVTSRVRELLAERGIFLERVAGFNG